MGVRETKGFINGGKKQCEKRGKEGMHGLEKENGQERQKLNMEEDDTKGHSGDRV